MQYIMLQLSCCVQTNFIAVDFDVNNYLLLLSEICSETERRPWCKCLVMCLRWLSDLRQIFWQSCSNLSVGGEGVGYQQGRCRWNWTGTSGTSILLHRSSSQSSSLFSYFLWSKTHLFANFPGVKRSLVWPQSVIITFLFDSEVYFPAVLNTELA